MNRSNAYFAGLVALAAMTVACGSDSKSSSTTVAPAATSVATTAVAATTGASATTAVATGGSVSAGGELPAEATVEIKQFKFGPDPVHVAVGGTVTWTNSDNQKHTATSNGGFDAGTIESGATGTATFATAGTFAYICSFHPFMKGTVIVGS